MEQFSAPPHNLPSLPWIMRMMMQPKKVVNFMNLTILIMKISPLCVFMASEKNSMNTFLENTILLIYFICLCLNEWRLLQYQSTKYTHCKYLVFPLGNIGILCSTINSTLSCVQRYNAPQKHESTLLHKYVLNKFLTANRSCTAKY